MKSIIEPYRGSYEGYLREYNRLKRSFSNPEILSTLERLFFPNLKKYDKTIESVAEQTHNDIHKNFPHILVENFCYYTASYFADVCHYLGVGDVSIVKGKHSLLCRKKLDRTWKKDGETGLYLKRWTHHWNFDKESDRFIDIKPKEIVICDRKDPQFNEDHSYREQDMDYNSEQILGFPLLETARTARKIKLFT